MMRLVEEPGPKELEAAFALRYEVFVIGQDVPVELERDGKDDDALHVVLFDGERAVATGRTIVSGETAKMQRIAVVADRRGEGLGRVVMDALERRAKAAGAAVSRLASQVSAVGFYERLGYRAVGDVFLEAGIEHRWMDKPLR